MAVIGSFSMALATLNFGLFIRPMGDDLGISRGVFGLAQSARMITGAATSPIVGKIIDRIGSRFLLSLAAFITGSAHIGVAYIENGWQLIALFAMMVIVAIGGPANLITTVPIAKWFVHKRGRAMAIVTIGPFAGGVIFVPFTQFLIDTLGWRNAWIALAVIGAGTIILIAPLFIRRQPEDMGLSPDGGRYADMPDEQSKTQPQSTTNKQDTEVSWTLQEALHSYIFWRLTAVFSLVMLAISPAGLHRVPNFVDKGLEPGLIALAMALDAAVGGVSTFAIGLLSERIPIRFLGSLAFLALAIAILLTITSDSALLMFLSFALFGAGIGGMMMLNSFLWADYFGRTHLGSIRGFVMPFILFFSAVGAPLAGYVKDITGTYNNIWWISIILLLIATGALARTPRPTLSDTAKS